MGLYELNGQATLANTTAANDDELIFPQKLQHEISPARDQLFAGRKPTLEAIVRGVNVVVDGNKYRANVRNGYQGRDRGRGWNDSQRL